ncbi:MAG: GFA family protein [Pseudomonadota bacterium]
MQGGCFCGSVRYELKKPPHDAYFCHCRDCQYLAGAPFHTLAIVDRGSIDIVCGETSAFHHQSQSGTDMKREFCPKCGTPLFITSPRFEDIQMFTPTTLDNPDAVRPSFQIWARSKIDWMPLIPEINCYQYGALDGDIEPQPEED